MTFTYPIMIVVTIVAVGALVLGYRALDRRRAFAYAAVGALPTQPRSRWVAWRRHVPPLLFLAGLAVLLIGVGRPQATIQVPHVAGTIVLAFDVSNSMTATDVTPSRLAVAQKSAEDFVRAQPSTVDIGVVAFDQGAIIVRPPDNNHDQTVTAIDRLKPAGGTSLGAAILESLSTIVGKDVTLPDPNSNAPAPNLGYWGSATIVVFSDGEDTGGPDAVSAAELAGTAGVHIQTVGVGTVDGTTITVNGYQVATALNEDLLTQIAQATAGTYHQASDAGAINQVYKDLEFRITSKPEKMELTGAAVLVAVALLLAGGMLMTLWYGRIV